jgi:hypothetical protein
MHVGKVAAYLLCRYQVEIVQQVDCDCQKQLTDGHDDAGKHSSPAHLKEKLNEHIVAKLVYHINLIPVSTDHSGSFDEQLAGGFVSSCFRPPSA